MFKNRHVPVVIDDGGLADLSASTVIPAAVVYSISYTDASGAHHAVDFDLLRGARLTGRQWRDFFVQTARRKSPPLPEGCEITVTITSWEEI